MSLLNTGYKLISEALAKRNKKQLSSLISPNHTAFLESWLISWRRSITLFPLISTPRCLLILRLLGAGFIRGWRSLEEGTYFKVREINNSKYQNLVKTFSFKMRMKLFTINKPNIIKKSKYQQYFHCFIVSILVPYAFWIRF